MRLMYLALLFILFGCAPSKRERVYQIGIDASFFPLDLGEKEIYVNAFTSDLMEEISKKTHLNLALAPRSWDDLIFDLKREQYDAIVSPMNPTLPNQEQFNFSNIYLEVGPVLVVEKGSASSLEKMSNAYIGVIANTRAALFVETQPNLMPKYYDNNRDLCEAVEMGAINGAFVDAIFATSFVKGLFQDHLKIASPPFFNQGIRLVTLKGQNEELVKAFNEALLEIKKKGVYSQLLSKWQLE
jgi:polar amino acid transport system substrate-binding protein